MLGYDSDRHCSGSWSGPEPEDILHWWEHQTNSTPNHNQPSDGQGPLQTLQQYQWGLDQFSATWLHHTNPLWPAPRTRPKNRYLYWQCSHPSESDQGQHTPMAAHTRDVCIKNAHSAAQELNWYHLHWAEGVLWVHSTGVCSRGGHRGAESHGHRWVLHPHAAVPGLAERLSRRLLQDNLPWEWSSQVSAISFRLCYGNVGWHCIKLCCFHQTIMSTELVFHGVSGNLIAQKFHWYALSHRFND